MNIKRLLALGVLCSMFFVGCSNNDIKDNTLDLPNEATKQKTMTKVQNDINEIKDKDYNYVLNNLGQPDVTSYWINKDDVNDLNSVFDLEKIKNINLVYLIENKKVKKVQIVDCSSSEISKDLIKSKILVNCYTNEDLVNLDSINNKNLSDFIGIDSNEMGKIVGNKKVSYDIHLFDKKNKSVDVYKLDDDSKLLVIFTEDNKISNIKVMNKTSNIIDKIKDEVLDK